MVQHMLAAIVFTSLGFLQFPPEVGLGALSAVAVHPSGEVFVLQRGTKPIVVFDKKHKFLRAFGEGLFEVPHGLRIDKHGDIWTTDNKSHKIRKFSTDGKLLLELKESFKSPDDLVFTSKGEIIVADAGNARLMKLTPDGKLIKTWGKKGKGDGEFNLAHSLAIDSQDRIYVGDRGNNRVQMFDTDGNFLGARTELGNPFGVMVWGKELLSSEGEQHKIYHTGLDGKALGSWGNPEMLQLPHIMAFDRSDTLYVAEVNGKRVQMFRRKK
jgi:DNA-binding beta-propeller fold protein YncE